MFIKVKAVFFKVKETPKSPEDRQSTSGEVEISETLEMILNVRDIKAITKNTKAPFEGYFSFHMADNKRIDVDPSDCFSFDELLEALNLTF